MFAIYYVLVIIMVDVRHLVEVHDKELMLQQMQIISTQCTSKSGSVDFESGDLHCNEKQPPEHKKFKPAQMPTEIWPIQLKNLKS